MSFYQRPHPWNPGYALPEYVRAEPPERGVFTTAWLPRGTISTVVPDFFAKPVMGLGDTVYELEPMGASGDEPIRRVVAVYGQSAASWIANTILGVPSEYRKAALRALLDTLDPSLWTRVADRMERSVAAGALPRDAMRDALAATMSAGMLRELVDAGKRGSIEPISQLGLGTYENARELAQYHALDRFYELGGWWDQAKKYVKKAAATAAKMTPAGIAIAHRKDIVKAAKAAGKGIASGAKRAAGWIKDGVKTLGEYACRAASGISAAGPQASAAAAATGPIGMAVAGGAVVAAGICGQGPSSGGIAPPMPPPPSTPSWVLPAAIGGGALVLFLAMRK